MMDYQKLFEELTSRYKGADPQAFIQVLRPVLIPIHSLDKNIFKLPGQGHYRATFSICINKATQELIVRGRTGKFVPKAYIEGGIWREIAKGRIIEVDCAQAIATGEVYAGGGKVELVQALAELSEQDYLEIDQYGAAAKVLSGLVEYSFARTARESGYSVRRMPEDMARHLGVYYHYDFELERQGVVKKVEVKSLWGTKISRKS